MVRSRGPRSKRSLSRSHCPINNKRVKSSPRDHEKERNKSKSRSRDQTHRSRSRDHKSKEERSSETRVQTKPLKSKRRSKSLSRSREERKEAKADYKPFDPSTLDKPELMGVPGHDDDWIVTDMVQDEEENDNIANENCVNSIVRNNETKKSYKDHEVFEDIRNKNEELPKSKCSHTEKNKKTDYNCRTIELSNTTRANHSKKIEKFDSKSSLDLELEHTKEFHRLRIKHEIERHDLEIKLLQFQINFWKEQCVENVTIKSRSNPTSKIEFKSETFDGIKELNSENKQSNNNINKSTVENISVVHRFNLTSNVGSQTEGVKGFSSQNKHSDDNINKNIIYNGMETNHIEEIATHVEKSGVN